MSKITDIINQAIRNEEEAKAFYQAIERRASDPNVKRLFLKLAQDENAHKDFLGKCQKDPSLLTKFPTTVDYKISEHQPAVEVDASLKPAQAIALAMKKEQEAVELYQSLAKATSDTSLKTLLEGLARMELDHKHQLEEVYVNVGYPESF